MTERLHFHFTFLSSRASLVTQIVKNLPARRPGFNPWVGKIPWRRKWQPNPVFLPGESHGQRSLVGYSPWGHKELNRVSDSVCLQETFQNLPVMV